MIKGKKRDILSNNLACKLIKIILPLAIMGGPFIASTPGLPENPPEAPQCPGDPNCPENNNPDNILDLFPPGLTLVATFPHFGRLPRNMDSEYLIQRL